VRRAAVAVVLALLLPVLAGCGQTADIQAAPPVVICGVRVMGGGMGVISVHLATPTPAEAQAAPSPTTTALPPLAVAGTSSTTYVRASKDCSTGLDLVFQTHGDVRTTAVAHAGKSTAVVGVGLVVPQDASAEVWAYDDGRLVGYGCVEDGSNACPPTTDTATPTT
jgi:hypothetical protein